MKNLLSIGTFSKLCRLTVKALRHYDELGLMRPAFVDPETGYRYYSRGQGTEAERIRLLRSLQMPLPEIRRVLTADSADAQAALHAHRERMASQQEETTRILSYVERLLTNQEELMTYDIALKNVDPQAIISIRTKTSLAEIGGLMHEVFPELFGYIGQVGATPVGPPGSVYHDDDIYREEDIDVEIFIPVDRVLSGAGRVTGRTLEGGTFAYTLHSGAFAEVDPAYRAVNDWLRDNGHQPAGPPREVYLTHSEVPQEQRAEVLWPVD